jgi:hypothetical protein
MPCPYYIQANIKQDECAQLAEDVQNQHQETYMLYNPVHAEMGPPNGNCNNKELIDFQTSCPNLNLHFGYGVSDWCSIDGDSELRYSAITHDKCPIQLRTEVFPGPPNMSSGPVHPDELSELLSGDQTREKRACNVLAGSSTLDNVIVPLVPCLAENIQNPDHIVPPWTWGGVPSRELVREAEYLEKCGYEYDGKVWQKGSR